METTLTELQDLIGEKNKQIQDLQALHVKEQQQALFESKLSELQALLDDKDQQSQSLQFSQGDKQQIT